LDRSSRNHERFEAYRVDHRDDDLLDRLFGSRRQ
jgi:hypothetical protein